MKPLRTLINFLTPENCLGCGREGIVVCSDCVQGLYYPDQCMRCKKPSLGGLTCKKCATHIPVAAFFACSSYDGLAKQLITYMKYHPSYSTAIALGEIMATRLPYIDPEEVVMAFVPTTPGRVRERGFDQARVMAKSLASKKKFHFAPLLRRVTKSHQVGSGKAERLAHMKNGFGVVNQNLLQSKTIILVDDVMTTGATLEAAARVLKKAGASRIIAGVFARAE